MNFHSLSTRGRLISQNLDLNERVQSREGQPKLLVINYLMNLCDKTQVQWFAPKTFNKYIARFSEPAGGGLQVQVLLWN